MVRALVRSKTTAIGTAQLLLICTKVLSRINMSPTSGLRNMATTRTYAGSR
jgi:hypothetical protein